MAPDLARELKEGITELRRAFPDYHATNEIQASEGDLVANRWVFHGTHQGEFMGIAETGREVTFEGLSIDRMVDGRIVESWVEWDPQRVLEQLEATLRAGPPEGVSST